MVWGVKGTERDEEGDWGEGDGAVREEDDDGDSGRHGEAAGPEGTAALRRVARGSDYSD
jgi:hypothetical protein